MKKEFKYFILVMWLCALLVSCGGGGGGSAAPAASVPVSALTKIVALTGGAAAVSDPFNTGAHREMMLYRASEMKGAGIITSISFKHNLDLASAVNCPSVTIKMSHTNLNIFTDTNFASQINTGQGSQQTVLNSSTVNIPAGLGDTYYTIPLTTPFNYNGVDNLVVEINRPACNGDVPTWAYDYSGGPNIDLDNTADAGAASGSLGPWLLDTKFNLSGGDNIAVGLSGAGSNYYPFTSDTNGQKVQLLYTNDEINGSGPVTGIAFPAGLITLGGNYTINVRMGHTNLTSLVTGSAFTSNFNTGTPVIVASGVSFSVPAGVPVDSYIWIPMPNASFNYNGTDNLIVEIEVTSVVGNVTAWKTNNTPPPASNRRLFAAAGATTGITADNTYYCIKFRFAGGTVDVITPTAGSTWENIPFNNTNPNKRQYLYLAEELGTKGSITKVACRIRYDSLTSDYNSFTVVLGHTASTILTTTFSANMADAQPVFSGTFTLPTGLKSGDWIEIPLSTPFAYDGTRNLVVQMSTVQGTQENDVRINNDDTLYLNRRAFNGTDNTTDTASATGRNYLGDLRLFMQ